MPAIDAKPLAMIGGDDARGADPLALLESLGLPLLIVDGTGAIRFRSAAAQQLVGDADRLDAYLAGARYAPNFAGWSEELRQVVGGESRTISCWLPAERDGSPRALHLRCSPMPVAPGKGHPPPTPSLEGRGPGDLILIAVEDVSQQIVIEERLAAAERLSALGKLAARVAHELNNPLDGILRYINLSLRVLKDAGDPKVRQYLEESRTGLMRMAGIIRELLEFSRASRGQFDVTAINDVAEQAIREYGTRAADHRVIVAADFQEPDLPGVRGNRLYQVCCNLLKNAIDAMPDGGRVTVTTGRVGDHAVIRVADTGTGLPDDAQQVFEPFFTTKQAGKGTGLGLAICKDYVTEMGGAIEAAPADGGGAVFTVRLPLARCHAVDTRSVARGQAVGTSGGREGRQP